MLITVTAPSGVGKTRLIAELQKILPTALLLESVTTRMPRVSDLEGEYTYASEDRFRQLANNGEFLWNSPVQPHGHSRYNTRKRVIDQALHDDDHYYLGSLVPDVLPALHIYVGTRGHESRIRSLYLLLEDGKEQERRIRERGGDVSDLQKRLESKEWNKLAYTAAYPLRIIDASKPAEQVAEEALEYITSYTPAT